MPWSLVRACRGWDLAASESDGNCATAGVKMCLYRHGEGEEKIVIEDLVHGRWSPARRDQHILDTARRDGTSVLVAIEQEGGSGGKAQIAYLRKKLRGFPVVSYTPVGKGSKVVRATALASAVQAKEVIVTYDDADWRGFFLDQVTIFPNGDFCDAVDAAAIAFEILTKHITAEVAGDLMCSGDDEVLDDGEPGEFDRIDKAELEAFSPGLRKVLDGFVGGEDRYGDLFGREDY